MRRPGKLVVAAVSLWLLPWLAVEGVYAAQMEYELSGSYEHFGRTRPDPAVTARFNEFIAKRTPPGQPARLTPAMKAEYEQLYGPLPGARRTGPELLGESFNREFKIWVRDAAWCIHTRRHGSAPTAGWEHGSVDGQEFQMSLLTDGGGAQGSVFNRPWGAPHSLVETGVPMLWMMTASTGYFDTLTNQLIWPAHMQVSLKSDEDLARDRRQPGIWSRQQSSPRLPTSVAFLDPAGRTNALYQTTGGTNLGKMFLPTGFIWERFGGQRIEGGTVVLAVEERLEVRFTNFSTVCTRKDLHPRVHPNMTVADYRVQQPTNRVKYASMKGYVLDQNSQWPSPRSGQNLVTGKRSWRDGIWVAALVAVVALGGAVCWLRRKRAAATPPADAVDQASP